MQENSKNNHLPYTTNYLKRERFQTREVKIGALKMGGTNPIIVQSMTTTDTMDTKKTIEQCIRMVEAGCELVRITAPSIKEAENLQNIKGKLKERGHDVPLVADIHFTPNAAEVASRIVEKVRVNPGNYADKKKFENIEYNDESYAAELNRIEEKFTPLVLLCKEHGTAMRIGTNHGSLSDRILSRYGDTPEGMVASAMEFIRICEKHDYRELVISMKASNTLVMVQAYRLLVAKMIEQGMNYPIHLGVTEAGDGEDGRIKSAVGIGALLEDGVGDTIRVSLTEDPEFEIPVARKLLEKYNSNNQDFLIKKSSITLPYNPYSYQKRETFHIENIGGKNIPVVICDLSSKEKITQANLFSAGYIYSPSLDKWNIQDQAVDYIYIGNKTIDFEIPGTLRILCDYENWKQNHQNKNGYFPIILKYEQLIDISKEQVVFFEIQPDTEHDWEVIRSRPKTVLILSSHYSNTTQIFRNFYSILTENKINNPVILKRNLTEPDEERFQLHISSELGSLFIDGFGDGIWIEGSHSIKLINSTSFGILQATRTRISKTEYISCPSCGRTLFDLQETTAKIRTVTSHLKGIKIGIMGCIVNGPGEMADADYGYVGSGPGKINLYKEKEVVKRNVPENEAVNALINLIKENNDWVEPIIIEG
jgi:(E)-4-hydroxy-3-methylbut-2-enyl-diphosphate synthase